MKLCLVCNFQTAEDQDICPRDGSSMVTVGDDPLLGMVVEGRYKIQSVIGQGSAGTVYKAVQELIGREVAIKVLHDYLVSDDEFIKRFKQEAKASSRLSHPNIITIYDFGVIPEGQRPYIAMDLLIGTPLSDLLAQVERIPLEEAMPIFVQVCSALGEAHRQGVVHRDVKPENIVLVERSGQRLFPIVVDFGIARIVEESDAAKITRTGTVCGSPTYMSPEQCTSSKVDSRSDIYSFGVVIYETLTGDVPFHSDELVRVMAMHLSDPPTPLNQVRPGLVFPEALEEAVYKSLAKSPDQRFQTMEEFAEALENSVKNHDSNAPKQISSRKPKPAMEPGALAQSDSLHVQQRSISQEMPQPARPSGRDFSNRALEEMGAGRSSSASGSVPAQPQASPSTSSSSPAQTGAPNVEDQVAAMRAQMRHENKEADGSHALKSSDFSRGRQSSANTGQTIAVVLVAIIGLAVLFYSLHKYTDFDIAGVGDNIDKMTGPAPKPTKTDAQKAIADGDYSKALQIATALKDKSLYDAYVKKSKQLYSGGEKDTAIDMLKKMPADTPSQKEVQDLLKKWEAKGGGEEPPPEKKKSGGRRRRH